MSKQIRSLRLAQKKKIKAEIRYGKWKPLEFTVMPYTISADEMVSVQPMCYTTYVRPNEYATGTWTNIQPNSMPYTIVYGSNNTVAGTYSTVTYGSDVSVNW